MQLDYATRELQRQCTDERYMQRRLGSQVAKALKLRIAELRHGTEMQDLLLGTGRWEEPATGQASGRHGSARTGG